MRVIVIGGGEVGLTIARHLAEEKIDVVLIEQDEARVRAAAEALDVQAIEGNGASPTVLREAGIADAGILVAVTSNDETNLMACAVASKLNNSIHRIARVRNPDYMHHIEQYGAEHLGVNLVFNLDVETARAIMHLLDAPAADAVRYFADGKVRLTGYQIQPDAPVIGRHLKDLAKEFDLRQILIVAIDRAGHVIIPRGDDKVQQDDFLWMIAHPDKYQVASSLVGKTFHPLKSVMIAGGTPAALHLAQQLEARGVPVKLIDENRERAEETAEQLHDAIVIHGRAIELPLLREESIGAMSSFVAATPQDEDNILAAILARREGVQRVIAMIERYDYAHVLGSIGVNALVSKNVGAVNAILSMVRKGKILSTFILGRDAEVIEYRAMETSAITKAPLKDLDFPRGALLRGHRPRGRGHHSFGQRPGPGGRPGDRVHHEKGD
ncbi:MAG: Trk system potassium transporter TrkA [Deltaproteobacteria bacterium]|nr:Trk system potassium transporter TrkA [Deltaproteobacteria bacterium]